MKNFAKYARYFNLFYKDKDYKSEADYVDRLIRRYSGVRGGTLLDIGCGTGNHDLHFLKKGYKIMGIDRSSKMISIARGRVLPGDPIEFRAADVSRFGLHRKFNTAVALFHVMSYLTDNGVFIESLKNICRHLKAGGLFIFDFWYGPAVFMQKPALNIKRLKDGLNLISRTATPKLYADKNTVDVCYKIEIIDKNGNIKDKITEHHMMRYFFLPELYFMLGLAGFKVVKCLKWMSLKEALNEDSWSGVIVAKK